MGQYEVIQVLKKNNRPMSRTEIAIILNERPVKISFQLKRLLYNKEIHFLELNRIKAWQIYKCKRRMRLYFIK